MTLPICAAARSARTRLAATEFAARQGIDPDETSHLS